MFCALHVSINSNSPSLISSGLSTCVLAICEGEFGPEKEYVHATESGNMVKVIDNLLLEGGFGIIKNEVPVDIDNGASLQQCQYTFNSRRCSF